MFRQSTRISNFLLVHASPFDTKSVHHIFRNNKEITLGNNI
jgi:hypothetical protein